MEPEEVLNLLDSFWFFPITCQNESNSNPSANSDVNPVSQNQEKSGNRPVLRLPTIHTRSRSHDQMMDLDRIFSGDSSSSSPNSVLLLKPHLETILSGKETSGTAAVPQFKKRHINEGFRRRRRGPSKSLSELEFEEVRGFMDLGFVFSEEDKNSSLAEIIPGLQRLGHDDGEGKEETRNHGVEEISGPPRARPYLSEAWEALEKGNGENPLMNWRVPAVENEAVMKDSLKWWAHTVALSAVR